MKQTNKGKKRKWILFKATAEEFCAHINATPKKKTDKNLSRGKFYKVNK